MDRELRLHKWLNGTATEEDIRDLRSDPEYAELMDIAGISSRLSLPEFNAEGNWQKISEARSHEAKVRRLSPIGIAIRIAAVLALGLFTYLFVINRDTVVSAEMAQRSTFLLPDSSQVTLNADSEIRYNDYRWEDQRQVDLEGEAFFKVAKGKQFDVNTPGGMVSVLGTEFNVRSREDGFGVICYEGLVQVRTQDTVFELPAGNGFSLDKAGEIRFASTGRTVPSWIENESNYTQTNFRSVLSELGRQYAMQIDVQVNDDKSYSGSFPHDDLELALRSVCEPLQLDYRIADGVVTIYEAK